MLELAKAIHQAIGIDSPRAFIAVFALIGLLVFGGLGWIIDRGYRTKVREEREHAAAAPVTTVGLRPAQPQSDPKAATATQEIEPKPAPAAGSSGNQKAKPASEEPKTKDDSEAKRPDDKQPSQTGDINISNSTVTGSVINTGTVIYLGEPKAAFKYTVEQFPSAQIRVTISTDRDVKYPTFEFHFDSDAGSRAGYHFEISSWRVCRNLRQRA